MFIDWLNEYKAVPLLFLKHPLVYWTIILSFIISYRRKHTEVFLFNKAVTNRFLEWNNTFILSLFASLSISFISLVFGLVITYEVILILCIVIIASTYVYHLKYASAAYTIGITYLLLAKSIQNHYEKNIVILASITILIGLFLIIEAALLKSVKNKHSAPEILQTNRSGLFGQLNLNKISFIPFFIFVPGNAITSIIPLWPTFTLGDETYGLVLIPFFIGFNYLFYGSLPENGVKAAANRMFLLGVVVTLLSIGSLFIPFISPFIVLIAIIGRLIIQFSVTKVEQRTIPLFLDKNEYVTVLWVVKGSPAAKIGLQIGDKIVKVNNQHVDDVNAFYSLLHLHHSIVQLDIIDSSGSQRVISAALFSKDQAELGLYVI